MSRVVPIMLCGLLSTGNASAFSGNEWKQLPPQARATYVWGVTNTWSHAVGLMKMLAVKTKPPGERNTEAALLTILCRWLDVVPFNTSPL
jgi:hypothetical protein